MLLVIAAEVVSCCGVVVVSRLVVGRVDLIAVMSTFEDEHLPPEVVLYRVRVYQQWQRVGS